ncbi:MAG: AlpA family transcriptional regulator [Moraxellaceae bacterium]
MKIMRLAQVMECTALGRSTIYKLVAAGAFPKPVSLGDRRVGWVSTEIEDWIFERMAERDD